MKFKKIKKSILHFVPILFLGLVPFAMSATGQVVDGEEHFDALFELKVGIDATREDKGDVLIQITPEEYYKAAFGDIQGVRAIVDAIVESSTIALYRDELTDEYNTAFENTKSDVEVEIDSYKELYGDEWEGPWQKTLEGYGFETTEEYIYQQTITTITSIATTELYKSEEIIITNDNGTPVDTSDDFDESYQKLNDNQLFWLEKYFTSFKPLHVSEIQFTLKSDLGMEELEFEPQKAIVFNDFVDELKVAKTNDDINLDFVGLASAYSDAENAENGGLIGLTTFNGNELADPINRYNVYEFVNDAYNGTLENEIVIDENTTAQNILDAITSSGLNYSYIDIDGTKYVISKNLTTLKIYRIHKLSDLIDKDTRTQGTSYLDYFANSSETFSDYETKPFDIETNITNYIDSITYSSVVLALYKGLIEFSDTEIISGQDMLARVMKYLDLLEISGWRQQYENYFFTLDQNNDSWDQLYELRMKDSKLKDTSNWGLWG